MEELQFEHTSGQWGFSLIHQRSVWRHCYCSSLLSHWLMQFTLNKPKRTFRFCCKKYAMKKNGIYVVT